MSGENNQFLNKPGVNIFKNYVDDTAKTLAKIEVLSGSDKLDEAVAAAVNPTVFIQPVYETNNPDTPKYYIAYGAKNGNYYPLGPSEDYIFQNGWKVIVSAALPTYPAEIDEKALYWVPRNLNLNGASIARYGLVRYVKTESNAYVWEEIGLTQTSFNTLCDAYIDKRVTPAINEAVKDFTEIIIVSGDTNIETEATKVSHPTLFMKPVYDGDTSTPAYYNGYAVKNGNVYPVGPDMSDILANNWKVIKVDSLPTYPNDADPQAVYIVEGSITFEDVPSIAVMNSFILSSSENNKYTWLQLNVNKTQMDKIANGYMKTLVLPAISDAIGKVNHFSIEVVTELPATGQSMTLYLVKNSTGSGTTGNLALEYIWIPDSTIEGSGGYYEQIGAAEVDLSGYWRKDDLTAITEEEMNELLGIGNAT